MIARRVRSEMEIENLRESVIKAMELLATDLSSCFVMSRTEIVGLETSDRMGREQISIGMDGADKLDGNTENRNDTDSGNGADSIMKSADSNDGKVEASDKRNDGLLATMRFVLSFYAELLMNMGNIPRTGTLRRLHVDYGQHPKNWYTKETMHRNLAHHH